jgi:hypothetical protein
MRPLTLNAIDLAGIDVTDRGVAALQFDPTGTQVYLDRTKITGALLIAFKGVRLTVLSVAGTEVDDSFLEQLDASNLSHLDLSGTRVTSKGIARLLGTMRASLMAELHLSDLTITPEAIAALPASLEVLGLARTGITDEDSLPSLHCGVS